MRTTEINIKPETTGTKQYQQNKKNIYNTVEANLITKIVETCAKLISLAIHT